VTPSIFHTGLQRPSLTLLPSNAHTGYFLHNTRRPTTSSAITSKLCSRSVDTSLCCINCVSYTNCMVNSVRSTPSGATDRIIGIFIARFNYFITYNYSIINLLYRYPPVYCRIATIAADGLILHYVTDVKRIHVRWCQL